MKSMKGFTIIELLIVVAIIGILAAIAIPVYQDSVAGEGRSKSHFAKERDCRKLYGPAWTYSEGWCYIPGTDKQERYQDTSPSASSAGPQVKP